ncbi:hypothetical protein DBZ36_17540 [Alginatibacterium sediminis]|uniref:Uncharacterized protein n=1 Tax=Alginatibacterium sediminis TaxID=2164068 RepID=A0A420E7R9_9ALTE|nr:hypothetical protein [Alginatibacterium sediminis]RKF14455.1 hypothetical protein DBZ36_17540 [Alginatibacterium sediminis]
MNMKIAISCITMSIAATSASFETYATEFDDAIADGGVVITAKQLLGNTGFSMISVQKNEWSNWYSPTGLKVLELKGKSRNIRMKWHFDAQGDFCEESYSKKKKIVCSRDEGTMVMDNKGIVRIYTNGKAEKYTFRISLGNVNRL